MPFQVNNNRGPKTHFHPVVTFAGPALSQVSSPAAKDGYVLAGNHLISAPVEISPSTPKIPKTLSQEESRFDGEIERAIHYAKKAREEKDVGAKARFEAIAYNMLRQLAEGELGRKSWKAHIHLAKAAAQLLIIEKAILAAKKAVALALTPAENKEAKMFLEYLEKFYGPVTFVAAQSTRGSVTKEGFLEIDLREPLISRDKKKVFEVIQGRFAEEPVQLPATFYFPFGKFTANTAQFEITQGGEPKNVEVLLYSETNLSWVGELGIALGALVVIGFGFMEQGKQTISVNGEK